MSSIDCDKVEPGSDFVPLSSNPGNQTSSESKMETQGLMDPQVADATVPPVLTSPEVVIAVREQPAMDDPIGPYSSAVGITKSFFNEPEAISTSNPRRPPQEKKPANLLTNGLVAELHTYIKTCGKSPQSQKELLLSTLQEFFKLPPFNVAEARNHIWEKRIDPMLLSRAKFVPKKLFKASIAQLRSGLRAVPCLEAEEGTLPRKRDPPALVKFDREVFSVLTPAESARFSSYSEREQARTTRPRRATLHLGALGPPTDHRQPVYHELQCLPKNQKVAACDDQMVVAGPSSDPQPAGQMLKEVEKAELPPVLPPALPPIPEVVAVAAVAAVRVRPAVPRNRPALDGSIGPYAAEVGITKPYLLKKTGPPPLHKKPANDLKKGLVTELYMHLRLYGESPKSQKERLLSTLQEFFELPLFNLRKATDHIFKNRIVPMLLERADFDNSKLFKAAIAQLQSGGRAVPSPQAEKRTVPRGRSSAALKAELEAALLEFDRKTFTVLTSAESTVFTSHLEREQARRTGSSRASLQGGKLD